MKKLRKVCFRIHSWIGVKLSILFFIVCFSGTLATLSHEMDWLFNPASRVTPTEGLASRNLIAQQFHSKYPNARIAYWMRPDEPYMADIIYKEEEGRRTYVFANRYTGEIQGETPITIQRFFRDLHYYLFIPFQIGHFTVLFFGFLLLISLVTALFFYKKWWKKLFELQTDKGILVLFRSLHRLTGLWSVPFSLIFSLTGLWYFLERANVGGLSDEVNPRPPVMALVSVEGKTKSFDQRQIDYDKAVELAQIEIPGLEVGDVLPPATAERSLYLTGTSDVPLVRQRANRVYINPVTYEVIKVQNAQHIGTAMWLNDIMDPLHFGSWGGLATKILWFLMGLGISSLILSGIWITLKRKAQQRKKQVQPVMGGWKYANWALTAAVWIWMNVILSTQYETGLTGFALTNLGFVFLAGLAYYFFVYRLEGA